MAPAAAETADVQLIVEAMYQVAADPARWVQLIETLADQPARDEAPSQGAPVSQVVTLAHLPNAVSSSWGPYTVSSVVPVSGTVKVQFAGDSGSRARGAPGLDNVH